MAICLFKRKILAIIIASAKLIRRNSELETINNSSAVLKEKEVLASAEKIKAGKPIFKANSFKTLDQSSPIFLNFCNKAVAKIIKKSGAMTDNI